MNQFQTWLDVEGNIYMVGGSLIDISVSPTAKFSLTPDGFDKALTDESAFITRILARPVVPGSAAIFRGGSGRNILNTGTLSGTNTPLGYFHQDSELTWTGCYGQIVSYDDSTGYASLDDAGGQIATMTGATVAPSGTFTSTAYGETTYNGGTPFTLTANYENRDVFPSLLVEVTAGTALAATYASTYWNIWMSAGWTVFVLPDGTATIDDGTDIVAERAEGTDGDGTGAYVATTYGKTTYNSGDEFSMYCSLVPVPAPIAGYLYVTVTLTAGVVTGLTGPFFATSMPANSATAKSVPIAYSDGSICIPLQQGPIFWK